MSDSLRSRVVTAVLLAPLAIAGVLGLPTHWFAFALGSVCAFGMIEWARLVGLRSLLTQLGLALLLVAMLAALWHWRADGALRATIIVGVAWWPLAALWLRNYSFCQAERGRNRSLKAAAGLLTVAPAWAGAVVLHGLPANGPWWVLFVLVLIWCADIGAYFVGKRYGTTKLAPRISPGKTRAGLWGALAASALYAIPAGFALGHADGPLALLVALALVTVGVSVVGDLFESLIKRHSNVKDSGSIFPGHGGVFDRFDSLFAALPVFAAGKLLLGL
jgi:phosphatidate cytidylyltransferase